MSHEFYADAWGKSRQRITRWHQNYLLDVLQASKERHVRGVDASIKLAEELIRAQHASHILTDRYEKLEHPVKVPLHNVKPYEDDSLMKPIEPEVIDLLYKSTEKGAAEKYLKTRYKKAPEDKFLFRICSNWDYGWQQKQAKQRARDVNRGRCAILRDTFYRKNNLAPDPPHYAHPSSAEISICSEYSCNFN